MTLLLSGSYSGGKPDGLNLLDFDPTTGKLAFVRPLPGAPDVSFIAQDPATRRLYLTDEHAALVGAFTLTADLTSIAPLGYQPSEAIYPCYVALSPDRTRLAVANYGNDLSAIFSLDPQTGALRPGPQVVRGTGTPGDGHAHWAQWSPEGDKLYIVDLGHDEVRIHSYENGTIGTARTAFKTPGGAGPRHLVFHPGGRFAYLVTEHGNTLVALRREADGTFAELHSLSTLPADFRDKSQSAHIAINAAGTVVYTSNRGHNSIAAFRIGTDGRLSPLQTIPCGGDWPRFFLLLENHLIVANQNSNDLIVFSVGADGSLAPTGNRLELPAPVMLLPL